ncbi:glycosyltransferase family 2 protein [Prosthecomicrobium hirschii]|uniref:glycosyltransferase family 2 protein n=1 Tax=Prosthecodimorpha hirschii TaxID=665126 RepID=UPI002220A010|nr:glycosyltransferase family 2 protein [Prosthecomicrobium hirschii]MCW1839513.1 glycosyltransferase family 2 protein [Prosthecomicrobium hirschii]
MTILPVDFKGRTVAGPVLSVVLPMRNESRGLDRLFARLVPVLQGIGLPFEIVAIDDGSTDDTLARLKALREQVPGLKVVSLSRNFGKEIGVTAGLARTSGRAVILMDSDLQHPPEGIPQLLKPWQEEGVAIVYARRVGLDRGGFTRKILTRWFYRLFDMMSEVKIDRETGDFMLIDRKVVDAFLAMPERNRFNRGLLAWAGFKTRTVPVDMEARESGASQFGILKLMRLAMNAITSFGTLPLRIWTYIGGVVSLMALAYGAYIFVRTLIFGADVPGYPSLIVGLMLSAGVQLIGLGIIGEYIGHVFSEVKRRPLYLVQETAGFEDSPADDAPPVAAAPPSVPGPGPGR